MEISTSRVSGMLVDEAKVQINGKVHYLSYRQDEIWRGLSPTFIVGGAEYRVYATIDH
tara:strand:- start:323 stop:496 length:174 start_codon:yes stop_codon:yes gene_type:complete